VRKSAKPIIFHSITTVKIAQLNSAQTVLHYLLKYLLTFNLAQRAQVFESHLGKERIRKGKYSVKKYSQFSQIKNLKTSPTHQIKPKPY
jgi:hypothetical protein